MDEDWDARIEKWRDGIPKDTASRAESKEYLITKLHEYGVSRSSDYDLWELFRNDFEGFSVENFRNGYTVMELQLIRGTLRRGGVYVKTTTNGQSIAQTLVDVLQQEAMEPWNDDEILENGTVRSDLLKGPITSVFLTLDGYSHGRTNVIPPPPALPVQAAPPPPAVEIQAQAPQRPIFETPPAPPHPGTPPVPPQQQQFVPQAVLAPETVQSVQGAKLIGEVNKNYTPDMKYDGTNSHFDYKLTIFHNVCERVDLPHEAYIRAFPIMLKGLALAHYYNAQLSQLPYFDACNKVRAYFEGPEYHRSNINKWNSLTLDSISTKHPDKSTWEVVQLLLNELTELQYGLPQELRTPAFWINKVVLTCQGSPACRFAVADAPQEPGQLINRLQSSITTYEREQQLNGTETYFTDRKYYSNNNRYDRRNGSRQYDYGRNRGIRDNFRNSFGSRDNSRSRDRVSLSKSCFICKKPGCRSWKHSPKEQADEKARFRARNLHRFKNVNSRDFEQNFTSAYLQHVADVEGELDDESDESSEDGDELGGTTGAFATLLTDTDDVDGASETHFTSVASLLTQTAPAVLVETANTLVDGLNSISLVHQLTGHDPTLTPDESCTEDTHTFTVEGTSRYDSHHFYGVVIDTGASKYSTAGLGQFQALQRTNGDVKLDETTKGRVTVQFGIGSTSSIGSTKVITPIGEVEFHVMLAKTPFLLSLADMDKLGVYFNNLTDRIVTPTGEVPVVRRFGHSFLLWDTALRSYITESFTCNPCFLTSVELRRLHRRFGHPSVGRLKNVLERAGHDVDSDTLEYLTKYCEHCQKHGKSPGRFKFNLRDDVNFNYSIIVDIFYITGKPVLHVVDEGTRYQAGQWLQNISATHTWDALRKCWIDTYLGPPDQLVTDAGKQFTSKEFAQHATTMGIKVKIVPIEAHNSIGIVERYHGPVRRAYMIISTEIQGIDKDMALQMAFKAVNDTAGPDGLVPTLLVYGALPRMVEYDAPSPTVAQRSAALKKAMMEIQKLRAKRQVTEALKTRNGPSTTEIHDLTINSDVLVWREGNTGQPGTWEGPYKLVAINGEDCVLALPRGNTTFRSTSVKPFYVPDESTIEVDPLEVDRNDQDPESEDAIVVDTSPAVKRGRGRPRKYADVTLFLQDDVDYETSRQTEITGLLEKGVFTVTSRADVPDGVRIFNSRFVDEIKHKGTENELKKSRLVVQAYNDDSKHIVLTQSPTIQRISQRIILNIAAMTAKTTGLYLRDISQAYVQSTTMLNRDFYVNPPWELAKRLNLADDSVLKVVKPLYGVPEAGNHWFKTYHSHHINELAMEQSTYDPCLLYSNRPFGVVGLQTDDTLFVGDDDFVEKEQAGLEKAKFMAKERERLTSTHNLKFNGGIIETDGTAITLTQVRQCKNLKTVSNKNTTTTSSRGAVRQNLSIKDQYIAQRARGAYISSVCQPESAYDLSVAAQAVEPTENDVKKLNKRIQWQIENAARGLRFVKLEKESLRLLVFTDASFANNKDLSSQIGYVLVLADDAGRANILHWSSTKCKRVTRSVLASELYGMVHGFDMGASVKSTVDKALRIELPLVVCTDSKSLYECLVKLGTTQEKRLMIDVMCLRQAYERREIAEVKWIKGNSNPADSMTKAKPSNALTQLLDTNILQLDVEEWVERE
jgi:hypothetical protein